MSFARKKTSQPGREGGEVRDIERVVQRVMLIGGREEEEEEDEEKDNIGRKMRKKMKMDRKR